MSPNRASRLKLAPALVSMSLAITGCADLGLDAPIGAGSSSFFGGSTTQEQRERLIRMGEDALRSGDHDTAVNILHRAWELDDKHPDAPRKLGDALLRAGRTQDAIDVYRALLRRNPTDLEGTLGYARAMLALGRPDAALAQIEEAQGSLPVDRRLANMTGVCLDLLGEHVKAQRAYRAGIEVAPDHLPLKNNLALSLMLAGDANAAVALLEPLARGANRTAGLQQSLAAAYVFKGDMAAANRLLRLDFGDAEVREALSFYSQLRGLGRSPAVARALLGGVEPPATEQRAADPSERLTAKAEPPPRAAAPASKPAPAPTAPSPAAPVTMAPAPTAPAPVAPAPASVPRPLILEPLSTIEPVPLAMDRVGPAKPAVTAATAPPAGDKVLAAPKPLPPKPVAPAEVKPVPVTAETTANHVDAILPIGDHLKPANLGLTAAQAAVTATVAATPAPVTPVPMTPAKVAAAPAALATAPAVPPRPAPPAKAETAAVPVTRSIPATTGAISTAAAATVPGVQTVATGSAATSAVSTAALSGDYVLYLGAAPTAAEVEGRWSELKKAHPDLLDELGRMTGKDGGRQTLLAGPFVDPIEAERTCAALLAAKVACTVKRL